MSDDLMLKAMQAAESARALLTIGDADGACNRAYYAMFDAARAACVSPGTMLARRTALCSMPSTDFLNSPPIHLYQPCLPMIAQQEPTPRIWIISLADAHERRNHMRAQLARYPELAFEFFDAIRISERSQYPADYDTHARKRLFGDDLRPGEVGCYMSHRRLWEMCAQASDQAWLILEDDIVLHPNFKNSLAVLMQNADEWDVVRLMQLLQRRGSWIHRHLDQAHALRAYDRQPSGMQGYLLKPAAARVLKMHAAKIVWPVDETLDLYWRHRQRLFSLEPPAIGLASQFESTIGVRSAEKRPKWRKLQRQLINGLHGLQRKYHNMRVHGRNRGYAQRMVEGGSRKTSEKAIASAEHDAYGTEAAGWQNPDDWKRPEALADEHLSSE